MVYKFFDKKKGSGISKNEQLAKELFIRAIEKFKNCVSFKGNICAADSAGMESLSSKNRNVIYLLCVTVVLTKYAWVKPINYGLTKEENFKVNLCKNG